MTLVKICGITRKEDATIAAREGADFIGFVLSSGFPRSVELNIAKEIVEAAREDGAEPVALFTKETREEMERLINILGCSTVQLHTDVTLKSGLSLDAKKIIVNTLNYPGFSNERDYYLYDKYTGKKDKNGLWFLAGGLNPDNVKNAIQIENPFGVDVSSGVEKTIGIKDLDLLQSFIRAVKHG